MKEAERSILPVQFFLRFRQTLNVVFLKIIARYPQQYEGIHELFSNIIQIEPLL